MSGFNIDCDLVSSKWDAARQVNVYVGKRGDDRKWTVEIPQSELQPHIGNKMMRRKIVTNFMESAMNSRPADGE